MPEGQLEALTGIVERRWWEPGYPLVAGRDRGGPQGAGRVATSGRTTSRC